MSTHEGSPLALDAETMRRLGYRTVDMLVERLTAEPGPVVGRIAPQEMLARVAMPPPEEPAGYDEILEGVESLHPLLREVTVGHRVADDSRPQALLDQQIGHKPRGRTLSGPGTNREYRDDRDGTLHLGLAWAQKAEVGSRSKDSGGLVHDVLMGHVAVGEHDLVDVFVDDQIV